MATTSRCLNTVFIILAVCGAGFNAARAQDSAQDLPALTQRLDIELESYDASQKLDT